MDTYSVELTNLEALYLSDSLSMFSQGRPDALDEQMSPYPDLLLKIGGVVLVLEKEKTTIVQFNMNELWMIREVAKSSVVIGSERVGISLLLKVYKGIRNLDASVDIDSAVSRFGEVLEEESGKDEYKDKLFQIKDSRLLEKGVEEDGEKYESNDANEDRSIDESKPTA